MFVCLDSVCGYHDYTSLLCTNLAEVGMAQDIDICLVTCPSTDYTPAVQPPYDIYNIIPNGFTPRGNRLRSLASKVYYHHRRHGVVYKWIRALDKKVDVVHFQQHVTPLFASGMWNKLRSMGIKVVITVHDIVTNRQYHNRFVPVSQWISRSAWRQCDAICVHSDRLRSQLSAFMGAKHPPIYVTQLAIWPCPPIPPVSERHTLLFFGVIHPYKGLDVLLRAMPYLPEYKLIIAGRPEASIMKQYMPHIRALISMLPPEQVELYDQFIPEASVAEFFGRSGLVVVPYTTFSSQSGVLHLALGYGRPVVVTDIGAMGDTVRELGVGEVVPPGDVNGLVSGIRRSLSHERYTSAVAATAKAKTDLTWARMAQDTINVYRSVTSP